MTLARKGYYEDVNRLMSKKKGRRALSVKTDTPALVSCPQRRGVCTRVYTVTPKKRSPKARK